MGKVKDLRHDANIKRLTVHGCNCRGKRTSEYRAWQDMKRRCLNQGNVKYKNWGGRGITVCDRWFNSFVDFLSDMGEKSDPRLTLERKNNNGNYEPGNCVWATWKEQANNRRDHITRKWFKAINIKTNKIIKSNNQREFARQYGLLQSSISACLNGRCKTHKSWKFEEVKS